MGTKELFKVLTSGTADDSFPVPANDNIKTDKKKEGHEVISKGSKA